MNKRRSCSAFLIFITITCSLAIAQQRDFALKSGDRVIFFGDSITEQKLYTSYVQQFVLSRYPDLNVTFINAGWGGDTVNSNPCVPCGGVGALARIERDVVAHKPTVVTLLFGMNDGLYKDFDPDVMKAYSDGLSQIIAILRRETKARIYVMTPTVYDKDVPTSWSHTDKYNSVLDRYSEAAKEIARREDLPVIDLHTATTVALETAKKADKKYTFFSGDGVHPAAEGQAVMAAEIVRAWGASDEGVVLSQSTSCVETKCVSSVSAPLPWPPVKLTEEIQKADATLAHIGGVTLKLSNTPAGNFAVTVDGKPSGMLSQSQLAQGILISGLSDSAQKESADLGNAVREKEDLESMRWRTVQLKYSDLKSTPEALAALQKMVEEQFAVAREKAKYHKYEITLTRQESK